MITEDYVSFELAKLLKEKGFNEITQKWYLKYKGEYSLVSRGSTEHTDDSIDVPTLQMAMKWLREEKGIAISVYVFNRDVPLKEDNIIYTCDIATANMSSKEGHLRLVGPYEEACEAAIKYCLENLI